MPAAGVWVTRHPLIRPGLLCAGALWPLAGGTLRLGLGALCALGRRRGHLRRPTALPGKRRVDGGGVHVQDTHPLPVENRAWPCSMAPLWSACPSPRLAPALLFWLGFSGMLGKWLSRCAVFVSGFFNGPNARGSSVLCVYPFIWKTFSGDWYFSVRAHHSSCAR